MARGGFLLLAFLLLQSCAIHKMMAMGSTQDPAINLPMGSKIAFVRDPEFKDSERFSSIVRSRFPRFAGVRGTLGDLGEPAVGAQLGICGEAGEADYLIAFHDFEIINKNLGVLIIGWERYVKYAAKAVVVKKEGCQVAAKFESRGWASNNGLRTGFGEIHFGGETRRFDADHGENQQSRWEIKEARDQAADDAEKKILKMLGIEFFEV